MKGLSINVVYITKLKGLYVHTYNPFSLVITNFPGWILDSVKGWKHQPRNTSGVWSVSVALHENK